MTKTLDQHGNLLRGEIHSLKGKDLVQGRLVALNGRHREKSILKEIRLRSLQSAEVALSGEVFLQRHQEQKMDHFPW